VIGMADIDVLATLPKTRREILLLLKRRVRATIVELAQHLGMTHEGIRAHILQLQQAGWVTADCESADAATDEQQSGRPPVRYCLSVAGEHVFPKRYDALTSLFMQAVAKMSDQQGLYEFLADVTDIRVSALGPDALASIYLRDDPFIEMTRRDGDDVIIERNCPFLQVALEHPAICSTTISAMRRLTGFEVVRERRFQDGDGRCEFRILRDRPVKRARRFVPEPPKEAATR
jgi:predicted ArsR family transcriptional regulator